MSEPTTPPTVLRTALGRHRIADLVRDGTVGDPEVVLDLVDVEPIHRAFAPMVRDQVFDVSELAIVTALQAVAFGRPIALLPVVVAARFQRGCLIRSRDSAVVDPSQLRGRRVGVRSYTQTTGFWIRSHLAEDHGVAAEEIEWITQDPAHVEEYREPPFVHRTLEGSIVDALRSGAVDAAILGNDLPSGDEFLPMIDHAADRDRAWYAEHGYVPVNHLVSVSLAALAEHPDAVRRAWDLLTRAEETASAAEAVPVTMSGIDRVHRAVDEIAASAFAQGMLPRELSADEVFAPTTRLLATHG